MKASKAGFITTLIIAVVYAVIGAVIMFMPNHSPVVVSEKFDAITYYGDIYIIGSIKNNSEETVTISQVNVYIITDGAYDIDAEYSKGITLAPGEVYDFFEEGMSTESNGYNAKSVSKVKVRINDVTYSVYDSDDVFLPVIIFIFAGVFLIISIISIVGAKKQQKRYDAIIDDISKMQCHAVFALGTFNRNGDGAKTAATVATTVMFGAIAGFGMSKATGSDFRRELILTDGGLYWCNLKSGKNATYGADFAAMNFIPRAGFAYSEVTRKKKLVEIKNSNGERFTFNLARNSQITPEELEVRLREFTVPAPVEDTPAPVEDTPPPVDPFGGEAAATYTAPAESTPAEPEKDDDAPKSGDNPFDEIG